MAVLAIRPVETSVENNIVSCQSKRHEAETSNQEKGWST